MPFFWMIWVVTLFVKGAGAVPATVCRTSSAVGLVNCSWHLYLQKGVVPQTTCRPCTASRNIKRQTSYKEVNLQYDCLFYICLPIIWYDTLYCDFYMFSSFNIDLGVVRWPPAQSCSRVFMHDVSPSLLIWVGDKMRMCGSADVPTRKMQTNIVDIIYRCDR